LLPAKIGGNEKAAMDEDEYDFPEPARNNPANDTWARAFRWVGLFCGLAMLGWTAVLLA